jgi:hypothetical protein
MSRIGTKVRGFAKKVRKSAETVSGPVSRRSEGSWGWSAGFTGANRGSPKVDSGPKKVQFSGKVSRCCRYAVRGDRLRRSSYHWSRLKAYLRKNSPPSRRGSIKASRLPRAFCASCCPASHLQNACRSRMSTTLRTTLTDWDYGPFFAAGTSRPISARRSFMSSQTYFLASGLRSR